MKNKKQRITILLMSLLTCFCMFIFTACGVKDDEMNTAINNAVTPVTEQITTLETEMKTLNELLTESNEDIDELLEIIEKLQVQVNCLNDIHLADTNEEITYTFSSDYNGCTAEGVCHQCGKEFSEYIKTTYENGVVSAEFKTEGFEKQTTNIILATKLTNEELTAEITKFLVNGERNFKIYLESTPDTARVNAVRDAIVKTPNVEDGSVNLTLEGITIIPEFGFGAYVVEVDGEYEERGVSTLGSVSLPDVIEIKNRGFSYCQNLKNVSAPNIQIIGIHAFSVTSLEAINFPKATTIGSNAFDECINLITVELPEAKTIGSFAFSDCPKLEVLNLPKVISFENKILNELDSDLTIYLTTSDDIAISASSFSLLENNGTLSSKVTLILNISKQDEVTLNTWKELTFKLIQYSCLDGTVNHIFESVTNNGNDSHSFTCLTCSNTINEACHGGTSTCKEIATCIICEENYGGYAEHKINPETGYCEYGCEQFMAVAKVVDGENEIYYDSLSTLRYDGMIENSTIVLLKDCINEELNENGLASSEYIEWSCNYTLDLNGFNLSRGGYELYPTRNVLLDNKGNNRAGIISAMINSDGKLSIGKNVDIQEIILSKGSLDLTNADFASCDLEVSNGINFSNLSLGNYVIYDLNGNMVSGETINSGDYIIVNLDLSKIET